MFSPEEEVKAPINGLVDDDNEDGSSSLKN